MPIDYDFDKLFDMLEKITFRERKQEHGTNRLGFPSYRGAVWGRVNARFKGWREQSADTLKHAEVYAELKKLGDAIVPFEWTSIQLARQLVCPPHKDKANIGPSVLISFGSYGGRSGYIYVDGVKYNAYQNALLFDGSKLEHFNTPITDGIKYSLIYFRC